MMRCLATILATACLSACVSQLDISSVMTLNMDAGEVQSTVVMPGLKGECANGRFLASNDRALRRANHKQGDTPLEDGTVKGRDLDDPSGSPVIATFVDMPPNRILRYHGNDHDLVVLPNGDVLLVDLTASMVPLTPKPAWSDYAYRNPNTPNSFGPAARTTMLIYRSTDCGETFHFLSEWDPAQQEDDSCANPQLPPSWIPTPTSPGSPPGEPTRVYDMGGSDGPLVKVHPQSGSMYMTHQCVGRTYEFDESEDNGFTLVAPLNTTKFLVSSDGGANWTVLGEFSPRRWRSGIVRLAWDQLLFGATGDSVLLAQPAGPGPWEATTLAKIAPTPEFEPYAKGGLKQKYEVDQSNPASDQTISANIWASQVISRVPGSTTKVLVAVPATVGDEPGPGGIGDRRGHGYRIFIFDVPTESFVELDPALPQGNSLDDFLLHLAAIDTGDGPVLLYWSDFDKTTNTATVRGRLIFSDTQFTSDFQIARKSDPSSDFITDWIHTWDVTGAYWYGDYQTGWGYEEPTGTFQPRKFHFYPVWPEPTNIVRYARVTVSLAREPRELELPEKPGKYPPELLPPVHIRTVDPEAATPVRLIDITELEPGDPLLQPDFDYQEEVEIDETVDVELNPR